MVSIWFRYILVTAVAVALALKVGQVDSMPADPGEGARLFAERGCVGCHAQVGGGRNDRLVELSPMSSRQVAEQLLEYRDTPAQDAEVMRAVASKLTEKEIYSLAAFLGAS